jgi:hypothetical protein
MLTNQVPHGRTCSSLGAARCASLEPGPPTTPRSTATSPSASWFPCTKHYDLGGAVPRRTLGVRRRAVGVGESIASTEGAFAQWRGYAVRHPTKYKRLRAAFPRSSLRRVHHTIGSNEKLATGPRAGSAPVGAQAATSSSRRRF